MKKRLVRREEDEEGGGMLFFTKRSSVDEYGSTKARARERRQRRESGEVKKEDKKIGERGRGEAYLSVYVC